MFRSLHRMFWAFALTATVGLAATSALALDSGWPRTLPVDKGMVTIYAPQVDGLDGDVLRYRAALAWRPSADAEPIFGAGWFESKVNVDRDQRIVHPLNLTVTNTRFPAGTTDLQPGLAAALAQQSPGWNLDFSLDQLDADLQAAQAETAAQQKLNTAPPQIVYRDHPALLVTMDGEPVLRAIENSPYQAVINTPYPLISDGKHFYLNAAEGVWYRANAATGPYAFDPRVPADIAAMVKPGEAGDGQEAGKAGQAPPKPVTAANAPEIVVTTVPAELIVTEGPADFVPLVDDLLVLQNSDDDVFMHVSSQQYYIVLAGRWYQARSLGGPWTYQAADQLPPAFANIPQSSEQADSRVYVAGTPEAEEAVLDAQVPQTAAVARGPADVDVAYDGEPEFEPVDGTDLEYATNTGATVLESDRQYYLVEDGVWYVSDTPNGPWQVSAYRPDTVNAIPPTSPVYNVKYVYIYDYTPDVVYVGYTPGYLGSYVYYDTVVYGTGWYYRPWVTPYYYYPRPSTWGFHVSYNPWYGWGFGLSWNWGWPYYSPYYGPYYSSFYAGGYWHHDHYWYHDHYGYWGPRGYRPHHGHHGYRDDRYAHRRDRYGDDRYGDGDGRYGRGDDRYGDRGDDRYGDDYAYGGRHDNLYRDGRQRARVIDTRDNPRGDQSAKQFYATRDKTSLTGTQPLKPSDLRMKAQLRDANLQASRKTLLADSSGKVYQKAPSGGARLLREARTGREAKPMTAARALEQRSGELTRSGQKGTVQNRTMPVPAKGLPGDKRMTAAEAVKRADRSAPKAATGAAARTGQPQARTKAAEYYGKQAAPRQAAAPVRQAAAPVRQAAAPVRQAAAPVRKEAAPARQAQFAPADRGAPRKAPAAAATPQPGSQNLGQAIRQKSYEAFSAPPRQPQARESNRGSGQYQSSAPPRSQSFPAPQNAPARVAESRGRSEAPPVQYAPRGSERSAGGPRGESARAGSRRGERD